MYLLRLCFISLFLVVCFSSAEAQKKVGINVQLTADKSQYDLDSISVVVSSARGLGGTADTLLTNKRGFISDSIPVNQIGSGYLFASIKTCDNRPRVDSQFLIVDTISPDTFRLNACPRRQLQVRGQLSSDDANYGLNNRAVVVKQFLSGQVQTDTLTTDGQANFRTTFQVPPLSRDSVKATVITCNGNRITKGKQVNVANTNQVNFTLNACPKAFLTIKGSLTSDDPDYGLDSIAVTIEEKFSSTGGVTTVFTDSGGRFRSTISVPASTLDTVQISIKTCNGDDVERSKLVNADSGLQSPFNLNVCPQLSSMTLSGSVATKQGRVANASVQVFQKQQAVPGQPKLKPEDSTGVDSSGTYKFEGLKPGTYYLRAQMPPEVTDSLNYMPTYFRNIRTIPGAGIWPNADSITLKTRDVYKARINMHNATKLNGPGFITGYVHERNVVGDQKPADDALVVLLDQDGDPVAFQHCDSLGFYEFPNVALGTYQLRVEVPGFPSEKGQVTLTQEDLSTTHIYFTIRSDKVIIEEQNSVSRQRQKPAVTKLYPNPVQEQLNLSLRFKGSRKVTLSISSLRGKTLFRQVLSTEQAHTNRTIPMDTYPDGVYLLKLSTGKQVITKKIVKN